MLDKNNLKPDLMIVDINAIGYASLYQPALSKLQVNGQNTAALHGGLSSVIMHMNRHPNCLPVIVWDHAPTFRLSLLPTYKESRSDDEVKQAVRDSYRSQRPHMQRLFWSLGIPQITGINAEADDIAGKICRAVRQHEKAADWTIQTVTKDSDWIQCLDSKAYWCKTTNDEHNMVYTLEEIQDPELCVIGKGEYYESVEMYVHCKSLAGDKSDCIPGIAGIGMATAAKLIREYGSLQNLWDAYDSGQIKKAGARILALCEPSARDLFALNTRLIDWNAHPFIDPNDLAMVCMNPNWDDFIGVCNEFSLKKIKTSAEKWIPHRDLWIEKWDTLVDALYAEGFNEHAEEFSV
jgi:5'-3' exonuclease